MDRVGHQAEGVDAHSTLAAVLPESVKVGSVIVLVSKRLSLVITPDNDVIEQTGGEHPETTGHDSSISKNLGSVSSLY